MNFQSIISKLRRVLSRKLIVVLILNLLYFVVYLIYYRIYNDSAQLTFNSVFQNLVTPLAPSLTAALFWHLMSKKEARHVESIKYTEVIQQISNAERIVRIQSTFSYLLDCSTTNHWEDFKSALSSLYHKNKGKGITVQILLLNPFSKVAIYRDKERGGGILKSLYKNLSSLSSFLEATSFKFIEVRVYDRLPGLQLHQIDSVIDVSYFPPDKPASDQRRMRYKESTNTADFHIQWFQETWEDELRTISLKEYMKAYVKVYANGNEIYSNYLKYIRYMNNEIFLLLNTDNEYIEIIKQLGGEKNKPFNKPIRNIEIGDNKTFIINKKKYRGEFITSGSSFKNACYLGALKYGLKEGIEFKVLRLE